MTYPSDPASDPTINYQSTIDPRDSEHLKILSILWYVIAGLQALGICGGIVYTVLGLLSMSGSMKLDPHEPEMVGAIFLGMGIFILILSSVMSFLCYLTGKSLATRRRIVLCYIMAGFLCLSIPLGTALGIFTFIVLARPTVKGSFT